MKKLLGLLSILAISGAAVPTTIAADPYQKEKIKLKNINNKRQKRNNNENKIKIIITLKEKIESSGVVLNNKLYFGSHDHNVYEYDPITEQQKIIIKTKGRVQTSGIIFNNKLYFGSHDHNVYEYDPITNKQKIVITANSLIRTSGVVLNNKLYFGSSDNNVYEYDPITNKQKIIIKTNSWIDSSGVVFNNKLYFGSSDHNVYEYDPITNKQKIVITANGEILSKGIVLNNKLYFGSWDHNVYEYDPITEQQKIIIKTKGRVQTSGIIFNNKLYFGSHDHNVYEYDPITNKQKIVITANSLIRTSGVVLNNKLYFGSHDHNVYEYDPITEQQKVVIKTNSEVVSSGVVLNNKLYFGSSDHNVYEYSEYFLNLNLEQINNNSNTAILNELNYLNTNLDITQLEIIKKTNNSASVKIKNNLSNNIINIKYSINNDESKIINLNELIKKAIFFKYRGENPNLKFKEINYIDTNNLNFSNVEVTKKENSLLKSISKKSICHNKEFINKTTNVRSFNIPACVYNSKYKLTFQIVTGLINKNKESELNGWSINSDDEMRLTEFINPNISENTEIINELSNNFDLSNINKQEQETVIHYLNESSDKFELNSNEKLQINYSSLITNTSRNTLNLKQKIMGKIIAKIISSSNKEQMVTFSIKEAMQILQKYSLSPDEITINEDNSITFNGKALISSEIESKIKTDVTISVV